MEMEMGVWVRWNWKRGRGVQALHFVTGSDHENHSFRVNVHGLRIKPINILDACLKKDRYLKEASN